MAIYIVLVAKNISSIEMISDRLTACYEAIKFFHNGLFFPREVEIWFDATSQALGGTLSRVIPINNLLNDVDTVYRYVDSLRVAEKVRTIIVFRGLWEIGDAKLAGYFSVHNSDEWKDVYSDIEISAYPKGDYNDLIDVLWSLEERDGIITKFIHDFYDGIHNLRVGVSLIAFSHGVWSKDDPCNLMAIYLAGGRRNLLSMFYSALKDNKDSEIVSKYRPLNTRFLIDTLEHSKIVEGRINKRLRSNTISELPARSMIYIAKNRGDFGKLFSDISQSVIKPAFTELPRENDVKERIERGLKEYSDDGRD